MISTGDFSRFLETFAARIHAAKEELTRLDSAIGDADHGINMDRGMTAIVELLPGLQDGDAGTLFKQTGMKLISTVGGASGPLYGTFFLRLGTAFGPATEIGPTELAAGFRAGLEGVIARGKAGLDDKTMVDAMVPAVVALEAGIEDLSGRPRGCRRRGGRRTRPGHPARGPQGPGELPRRTLRRPPGSRCDEHNDPVRIPSRRFARRLMPAGAI